MTFALASSSTIDHWPIFVLLISVAWVVFGITKLKLHPFLSLMVGAILVGWMTPSLPEPTDVNKGLFQSRVALAEAFVLEESNQTGELEILYRGEQLTRVETSAKLAELSEKHGSKLTLSFRVVGSKSLDSPRMQEVLAEAEDLNASKVTFEAYEKNAPSSNETLKAINWTLLGFGDLVGGLGLLIAMAAIIGTCMMLSGAADRVVRSLMNAFGEKRAGLVLLLSGFFLSIPVFFDTVFFLLIPLARALALRTGKHYTFYVMAMAGAGAITHSLVPPTPGPLFIAKELDIELGFAMMFGLVASILPAYLVLKMASWFDRKYNLPMREASGASNEQLKQIVEKKDEELPGLLLSSLPIALPVLLISLVSILGFCKKLSSKQGYLNSESFAGIFPYLEFLGNSNVAMTLAAGFAILGLVRQMAAKQEKDLAAKLGKTLQDPLSTAGVILLITGAGGAFGAMIRMSGVGDSVGAIAEEFDISYVLLAWGVTAFIRIAQGSATVSMITGVGLIAAVIGDGDALGYHKAYVFLAIGFGSITLSWMNDSGFWVVQRLSGFTEKETLKTWSVLLTAISLLGLALCLLGSALLPLV
ncbi:GntP family permease [Verrucomicrobia bacterium]|nr:GntP family permease [Verrucomicrobiota bacterium]